MPYMIIRHAVEDFDAWKAKYVAHQPARQQAALHEMLLLRDVDDPNEITLVFKAGDLEAARSFAESADLRERMQQAGVVGEPQFWLMDEA